MFIAPVAGRDFDRCEERLVAFKVLNQCSTVAVNDVLVFLLVSEILQNFHDTVHAIQQCLLTQQHTTLELKDVQLLYD